MKLTTNILKLLSLALFVFFISCKDDDCPTCSDGNSTFLVDMVFDGQTYNLEGGYDFGEESETYIVSSVTQYYEDYSRFELSFKKSGFGANDPDDIFPTFIVNLNSNEDPTIGIPQTISPAVFSLITPTTRYTQLNEDDFDFNNDFDTHIDVTDFELEITDIVRNSETGVHKLVGNYSVSFTSGRSATNHTINVNFDMTDQNILGTPYSAPTGGGGNSGGGNSGGNADCDNLVYNGPTEGQVMQWCQAAQLYECLDATTELSYICDVIAEYGASCPYCN